MLLIFLLKVFPQSKMLLTVAVLVGSLLVGSASAQCPPITTEVTYGATTATVSSATRATVTGTAYASQRVSEVLISTRWQN